MAEVNVHTRLVKLADSELRIDPGDDIRGLKVYDRSEQEIGRVADLLVDEAERRARVLEVESGGVLGIDAKEMLVPVEAVSHLSEKGVHLDQTSERVSGAPRYDPELDSEKNWTDVYGYWGYNPFWRGAHRPPIPRRGPR
jgi:sporulation protein YlmC with PRC-barrel domain